MRFRPCIDLRDGRVVQIVGDTLDDPSQGTRTNFTSRQPASWFARRYRGDGLSGGHVIMLGPGNETAAAEALEAFPGGLQIGGGMNPGNAPGWLRRGAGAVIATSCLFEDSVFWPSRAEQMAAAVGAGNLVLDLSCAPRDGRYFVAADRWRTLTDFEITGTSLESLAPFCSEFLVHGTQVEGRQGGIDGELVRLLAGASPRPATYAGGIASMRDVELVAELGQGRLDFTVGSALDLFGGTGVKYRDLVEQYGGDRDIRHPGETQPADDTG